MADYYPLLAKAVGGLQQSTPDARRAIYERARKALIGQLRAMNPPVPEPDIQRENQALDDAIARLEVEWAPKPEPVPPEPAARADSRPIQPEPPPKADSPEPQAASDTANPTLPGSVPVAATLPTGRSDLDERPAVRVPSAPTIPPLPPIPPRPPLAPQRARPVAPVVASASAPPEASSAIADALPDFSKQTIEAPIDTTDAISEEAVVRPEGIRPPAPQPAAPRRGWIRYVIFLLLLAAVAGGIGFLAWRLRDRPEDLLRARPPATPEQADGPGKIIERIGGAPPQTTPQRPSTPARPPNSTSQATPPRPADPPQNPAIPVAQRAAMLVDAPEDPAKFKTYIGNVVWRLESMSRGPGQPLAQAVRAEADISEARVKVTVLLQKNVDETLPASHLMTVLFAPAPDSGFPAVDEIDIPQMRNEVSPAVDALVGVPAKITSNMFLVGLARDATFQVRNIDMLKSRGWLDIPLRFADGRIAKVTFEKGPAGDRAIADAFQAWGP